MAALSPVSRHQLTRLYGRERLRSSLRTSNPRSSMPPVLQQIIDRYLRGEISGPMAVMELVQRTEDVSAIEKAWPSLRGDRGQLDELHRLLTAHRAGCHTIVEMIEQRLDSAEPATRVDEGIERARRLFDASVAKSEEASVALYSLGSAKLLAAATAEVVEVLSEWGVLGEDRDALEIGCGIGRFLVALGPRLRSVIGTDVSAGMIAAAERRLRGEGGRASARLTSGQDLSDFADGSFDLVYSIDAFPYLVLAGRPLVERHFREIQRVLRANGDFVLFSYAYGRARHVDDGEVRQLASSAGLSVVRADQSPLTLWNGVGWHLRREARGA